MLLLIDNYDSFTHLLAGAFSTLGREVNVVRNDAVTVEQCLRSSPSHVVVGPGPGCPDGAGASLEVIAGCRGIIPILGVCLGMQAIASCYGGRVVRSRGPRHGKVSAISHTGEGLFEGLSNPFLATRYHSLVVERGSLPLSLEVTAFSDDGEIMALRAKGEMVEGVQFHPESVMTAEGLALLTNFLENSRKNRKVGGACCV